MTSTVTLLGVLGVDASSCRCACMDTVAHPPFPHHQWLRSLSLSLSLSLDIYISFCLSHSLCLCVSLPRCISLSFLMHFSLSFTLPFVFLSNLPLSLSLSLSLTIALLATGNLLPVFQRNNVEGEKILTLTRDDLRSMGLNVSFLSLFSFPSSLNHLFLSSFLNIIKILRIISIFRIFNI